MDTTVIVALPEADDKVNRLSSETAHLTLCFLGPTADLDLETIVEFVQHAASQLSPFWMEVDYRGTLGPDDADVLFFKKDSWSFPRIADFRGHLLQNDAIEKAYLGQQQYPEWTPHLTMGYPATPAHEDDSEHKKIHSVQFDRIAIWTSDNKGLEFRLKFAEDNLDGPVGAWSDMSTAEKGEAAVNELFHYGVKGMKWGVRRDPKTGIRPIAQTLNDSFIGRKTQRNVDVYNHRKFGTPLPESGAPKGTKNKDRAPEAVTVAQKKPGQFAKSQGGQNHPLHPEAKTALEVRQKAKASTTDALSNVELRTAIQRMQLEQQYSQLAFQSDRRGRGKRFVDGLLGRGRYGSKEAMRFKDIDEEQGKQVGRAIKQAAKSPAGKQATSRATSAVIKKAAGVGLKK